LPDFGGFIIPVGAKTISSPDTWIQSKKAAQKTSVNLEPGFVGSHGPNE
jgi:hypothetical protein